MRMLALPAEAGGTARMRGRRMPLATGHASSVSARIIPFGRYSVWILSVVTALSRCANQQKPRECGRRLSVRSKVFVQADPRVRAPHRCVACRFAVEEPGSKPEREFTHEEPRRCHPLALEDESTRHPRAHRTRAKRRSSAGRNSHQPRDWQLGRRWGPTSQKGCGVIERPLWSRR
jgi:hypothetical protein